MKRWRKGLAAALSTGLLTMALTGNALAAEERTKISQVSLKIESLIEAGQDGSDVNVSISSGTGYSLDDVTVKNDDGEWISGDEPRVEITLEAEEDYYFDSMSKSKVKLSGDKATYVTSSRRDNKSTLVVTVKLGALEGSLEVDGVEWEGEDIPVARWESTAGAKSYQVRLYREDRSVGTTVTTSNEYYNFSSSITREGDYYFKVRAVNSNSKKGEWYESDSMYVDGDMAEDFKNGNYSSGSQNSGTATAPGASSNGGTWKRNNVGWWYEYSDGSYPRNGWLSIKNVWYCFDAAGYMRMGWIQAGDGKWYYCDPREGSNQGAMMVNTTTPDGYRVDANGVWIQ